MIEYNDVRKIWLSNFNDFLFDYSEYVHWSENIILIWNKFLVWYKKKLNFFIYIMKFITPEEL